MCFENIQVAESPETVSPMGTYNLLLSPRWQPFFSSLGEETAAQGTHHSCLWLQMCCKWCLSLWTLIWFNGVPPQNAPTVNSLCFLFRKAMLDNFWRLLISNIRVTTSSDPDGWFLISALLLSHPSDLPKDDTV